MIGKALRAWVLSLTALAVTGGMTASAFAAESASEKEQQMMAAMMKAGTPGEHHKALDVYAGSWDVKITMWNKPDAPPQTSVGASEVKWILDGRFLREDFASQMDMGGQTFQYKGMGLIGYDNLEKEYVSIWLDNMSTAMMIFDDNEYDTGTKTLTLEGEMDDPMLGGEEVELKLISRVVSENEIHVEMHKEPEGGEEHKCFEMVYTRQQ